jgi:hypothetical protein
MLSIRVLLSLVFLTLVYSWSQETFSRRRLFDACKTSFEAAGMFFVFAETAEAYERRDVGDPKSRSPATAAMNEQAYQTNNRLEKSGFKLDTREEEQARLSAAMASFSYDASTTSKKQTGFRSSAATKDTKPK